jgi:ribonuclease P protein component
VTPRLRLPRAARIRDDAGVGALQRVGASRGRWFAVAARANGLHCSRLAVRVAKRVMKSAVARNRMRRCVKEIFRHQRHAFAPADCLVSLIKPYREDSLRAARLELERLLRTAMR